MVLDSDVLIELLDKKSKKGDEALRGVVQSGEAIALTSISLHEVIYGLFKFAKPVEELLQLPVLAYTRDDATLSARIELEAERKGRTVRRTDAMIAATAINRDASLFTFDLEHFSAFKTAGLRLFALS